MSKIVYTRSKGLTDVETHYCPGCTHGIIHKLVAETMVELDIVEDTIGVCPVGCSVFAYKYFACDMQEAAHGRAPAVATGIKRVHPDKPVFTYQGDGDLVSIGMGEIIHAAARGEKITVIFVNNAIYGMTGGQMAPTTLVGQKTTTSPFGRDAALTGNPIRMCEMIATLDGAAFVERVTVTDSKSLLRAKRAIKRAFELQQQNAGFTFVEVLSTCPTNWGINPRQALTWLNENMIPVYPLGNFKDVKVDKA
ncbi:MAG: 2-oxoglutarate oxidoreductase [Clostridiales bacterium]|nr:2-oxoglutarate oxidoreductase [Clostridiales bacterium]